MKKHQGTINSVRSGTWKNKLTRHYAFAGQHGVIPEFFILAQVSPSATNRTTANTVEGLMQLYLNLVSKATGIKDYHNPATTSFIAEMRASVSSGLPDLSDVRLNSDWSFKQGESQRSIPNNDHPNCLKPETAKTTFLGSGEDRRCKACSEHTRRTDEERGAKEVKKAIDLEESKEEGCKNPNCMKPDKKGEVFTGVGEDRRCNTCHVYRRDHNQTDRSRKLMESVIAVRESKGQGCKNPNCLKPAGRGEFRLQGEQRRCLACYKWMRKKEKKGKERPASLTQKGRDW